jgi:hypothetical protein
LKALTASARNYVFNRAERELRSYNNPPRVADSLYQQMGRLDDALAAYDRALQKSCGTPKLNLYLMKGWFLERKAEVAAREEGLRRRHCIRRPAPLGDHLARPRAKAPNPKMHHTDHAALRR